MIEKTVDMQVMIVINDMYHTEYIADTESVKDTEGIQDPEKMEVEDLSLALSFSLFCS